MIQNLPLVRMIVFMVAIFLAPWTGSATVRGENAVQVASAGTEGALLQPRVALNADGTTFVVFGHANEVRCAVSRDGGQAFETPVVVGSPGQMSLGLRRGPRIAAAGRSVVITAIGGKEGKGRDGDVWAWRSTDEGRTWSRPARVNDAVSSAREGLHAMASGPEGKLFCVWIDLRNNKSELYGSSSTDGGATWSENVLAYHSPDGAICPCCHPSAAYDAEGNVYVMWRNQLGGARDMYLSVSHDEGHSFSTAEKLGTGTWPLNICPMDGGEIAAAGDGKVFTAWMRDGSIYTARPGQSERSLGPGIQATTALGPDGPYTLWLDRRGGKLLADLPGAKEPVILATRAVDPVVVSAPGGSGPVVAVWEDQVTGNIEAQVLSRPAGTN